MKKIRVPSHLLLSKNTHLDSLSISPRAFGWVLACTIMWVFVCVRMRLGVSGVFCWLKDSWQNRKNFAHAESCCRINWQFRRLIAHFSLVSCHRRIGGGPPLDWNWIVRTSYQAGDRSMTEMMLQHRAKTELISNGSCVVMNLIPFWSCVQWR